MTLNSVAYRPYSTPRLHKHACGKVSSSSTTFYSPVFPLLLSRFLGDLWVLHEEHGESLSPSVSLSAAVFKGGSRVTGR